MPQFKTGTSLNLSKLPVDVEDNSTLSSAYFSLSEFNSSFGLGKNSFVITNAPKNLQVEILDSNGIALYIEKANNIDAVNIQASLVVACHVYTRTNNGLGTLIIVGTFNNKTVRYTTPIDIDVTKINISKVRFYNTPLMEVNPKLAFSTTAGSTIANPQIVTGSFYGKAVYPNVNFLINDNQYNKNLIDYQIISTDTIFSSSMKNFFINLQVDQIKKYNSAEPTSVSITSSTLIKNVINTNTLQLNYPITYNNNTNNKKYVADVVSGTYTIIYSAYNYDPNFFTTASYIKETTSLGGTTKFKQYSIAEIAYKNLDTFSGTVIGHRVYRKSLNIASDYSLIIDEKFATNELLKITKCPIKPYENLGGFYNQNYINLFWFTSSNNIQLQYDKSVYIDSIKISGSFTNDFFMTKLNTSPANKNVSYIPYNDTEYTYQSGSSYDCNFIQLKENNEYVLGFNCSLLQKPTNGIAKLDFYLTGSYSNNIKEKTYNSQYGVKIADLYIDLPVTAQNFQTPLEFKFTPTNTIRGTLVVVPSGFSSMIINNLSLKLNTTPGFSPQSYTTTVTFPINQPSELFDIKSELYDINSNVVYSDLRTITQFDPSGSSSPPVFTTGSTISASNVNISGHLLLDNISNWGTLAAGDFVLGWDGATHEVGYYITPNLASGSTQFAQTSSLAYNAITASYALTASYIPNALLWHSTPANTASYGEEGWMAYDNDYHYIYAGGRWHRQSVADF